MRVQPLRLGEADRRRGECGKARSIAPDDRAALKEIENSEARGKSRAAGSWQDVVGPGDVVADRLGSVAAEEHCSGVVHPVGEYIGIIERKLEVLGGDPVDQRRSFVPIGDKKDRTMRCPTGPRDLRPWQLRQVMLDGRFDFGREIGVVSNEDRLRHAVVLGLR